MYTTEDVREENDKFRSTLSVDVRHMVFLTPTVAESTDRDEILKCVREFSNFEESNDPYGEHDFGKVVVDGRPYFWKIDYYDQNFEFGADPHVETVSRVLTVMRADEY